MHHSDPPNGCSIQQQAYEKLSFIKEPKWGINVVDCGLILGVKVSVDSIITLEMTLIDKESSSSESMIETIRSCLEQIPNIGGVDIELIFEPAWSYHKMSDKGRKQAGLLFFGAVNE